jgi:hypothetical protein
LVLEILGFCYNVVHMAGRLSHWHWLRFGLAHLVTVFVYSSKQNYLLA